LTAPRVLLVEHLDAIGATPSDARLRAGALRAAGASVELVVLDSDRGEDLQYGGLSHRRDPGMTVWNAERAAAPLARLVREQRFDLALWASARPDDALAGQLPAALPAYHWSTGFASHGVRAEALAPLDLELEPCAGSTFDLGRMQRGRLSLWDGPFALVPAPLESDTGVAVLEAFAATASDRDEVDLVVLDHLRPALVCTARELGIELRVHFVGPAPREAEVAWLQTASVALVGGEQPVSAGLVLRALASGCPMLPVGEEAGPLAGWLLARGLAPFAGSDAESLGQALDCVLGGGARVAESRTRSRSVAERYTMEALTDRFARALARLDARHDGRAA
jgi:hypothetical protein